MTRGSRYRPGLLPPPVKPREIIRQVEVPVDRPVYVEVPGPERVVEVPGPERIVEIENTEKIDELQSQLAALQTALDDERITHDNNQLTEFARAFAASELNKEDYSEEEILRMLSLGTMPKPARKGGGFWAMPLPKQDKVNRSNKTYLGKR